MLLSLLAMQVSRLRDTIHVPLFNYIVFLHNLLDQPPKGGFAEEEVCGLLVLADFSKGDGAR